MLQLPQFLQKLMTKLRKLRDNSALGSLMNSGKSESNIDKIDRLAKFEDRMAKLEDFLHSPKVSEFAVVTIPTEVALAETERLLQTLVEDNILVRRVIVNQIIENNEYSSEEEKESKLNSYLNRMRTGQQKSIDDLTRIAGSISAPLVKVPYFDTEVRTVYGLRAIGKTIFP
jgi:arsenite-transporting ATPase